MAVSTERVSSNPYLVDYFIYCPLLCEKEGQEARKILYYYPATVNEDRQVRTVGYCEGLVKFTETFGFDEPCESVHFQKTRLLFYKAEHEICLAMTLHVPVVERRKEDTTVMEYYDENINDRVMQPLLQLSYRYFALQYGTMTAAIARAGVDELRRMLKQHYDAFIQYHLHTMIQKATFDTSLMGIPFLPVEKKLYLKIQSLLRKLELKFLSLKETLFLYRDQVIWSGLSQQDTTLIYSFFRVYYWSHLKSLPVSTTPQFLTVDTSSNLADELRVSSNSNSDIYQAFFLGQPPLPHRTLVININFITIFCFFHDDDDSANHEVLNNQIVECLKKEFDVMLPLFEEHLRRKFPSADANVKTVYYNRMNMAHSSTIDWTREPAMSMSSILNTLAEDMRWFHPSGEIMVKRETDPWIIAKRSDMRELLIVVNQKTANLKEIHDKVKQIIATQFSNIFLLERKPFIPQFLLKTEDYVLTSLELTRLMMNGSTAVNEQLIGKFHVEKLPNHILLNADDSNITSLSTATTTTATATGATNNSNEEQSCPSRFQMIRVDRNFGRGRWKVNDFEPPENTNSLPIVSSVTITENESNPTKTIPTSIPSESTVIAVASAPSVFPAKTTAQQRLSVNNTPMILPPSNVPSPAGLLHAYPPAAALTNLTTPNQSFLLTHHHHHPQFSYFPFYPPPYSPYAAQWAALAAANPYLPPPPPPPAHPHPPPPAIVPATASATLNDPITDVANDNPVISSTTEHLNNPPAIATTPFLYAPHHSHSPYVPQHAAATTSPYATIPSYHPVAPLPTIVPPSNPNVPAPSNETTASQQAPLLASPKQETTKNNLIPHSALIITPQAANPPTTSTMNNGHITDLISASPLLTSTEQAAPVSLLSPVTTANRNENANHPSGSTSFPDIWSYTNGGSPLNLTQTAAAAISLLNNETNPNAEITTEILKELTTPTKQNHTTDIDNKISAAMDLVKMHLLSAVREEVTELRQQIRTLQEKLTSMEHENAFLRQHVSSEIFAQYSPLNLSLVSTSDSSQPISNQLATL